MSFIVMLALSHEKLILFLSFFFPFFFYLGPSALQATPTDGSTWRLKDGRKYALVNVALYQV